MANFFRQQCNAIFDCLPCVTSNCYWIENGTDVPPFQCIIKKQLSGTPGYSVSPWAPEQCLKTASTTPFPFTTKIKDLISQQEEMLQIVTGMGGAVAIIIALLLVYGFRRFWRGSMGCSLNDNVVVLPHERGPSTVVLPVIPVRHMGFAVNPRLSPFALQHPPEPFQSRK